MNNKTQASNPPVHPLGTRARVLLTSVFGPYGQDDEYGSRKINPMELYHNQVTRVQGGFSLRMFHRSFGLLMIQANIDTVTEQLLEEIIKKLPRDTTKIIIAHRLNTIDNADEIFFVNAGQITRAGSMEQAVKMLTGQNRAS